MFDGTRLKQSWYEALDGAQTHFRQLLTSHSSNEWKRASLESSQPSSAKGKARVSSSAEPHLADVVLHRRLVKGESVYRAVLDVPAGDEPEMMLEACKSVLATPELRKEWDPSVDSAQLLEMFDQATRICKTNFMLGWPASPRDAVTISRTFSDATTVLDITTSLPRSPDEPTYLRPSPPFVRSEVGLFAWCIQHVQQPNSSSHRIRFTCFWQHDLRAMWNIGTSNIAQQLCSMMVGFFKTIKTRGGRIPLLAGYGNGVSMERVRFQIDREALTVEYSIVPEEEDNVSAPTNEQGLKELHSIREHRRLTRTVEWALPATEGWDVQISTKASSEEVSLLPWTAHALRGRKASVGKEDEKFILNMKHAPLPNDHSILKVTVVIELSGPSSGWRLNGIPQPIEEAEERDPSAYLMSRSILQDTTSMADMSFRTKSTANTVTTQASSSVSTIPEPVLMVKAATERSAAADRSILSRVKRNYIYFSSLLQEPEAKWKRTTEARGVSIAQLDSIDPTLVVYRAEATFVGLSLWDLYAAITTPGTRSFWDRLYDEAVMLEDVNQLTELWHYKAKPAWPVNGRDAVVLKTVYKSPTTIHVFAFSADDPNLFPNIPPVEPNVIRTQVDLQGWAIEALSPTTTLVTLLEQSDPKGWSNKGSIPQQMISTVAGIGDFVIKCGGPPVATRLEGARANEIRYDHEKGNFRIEYEGCSTRKTIPSGENTGRLASATSSIIECELRCDLDNWATSLDIVIDPPPQAITCLRRHRLSGAGGGLWLAVTHDAVDAGDERLHAIVRRAPQGVAKEKGIVMVNGARVEVDVEELPDKELKSLVKQKRIKPARIPLDQPPVLGVIRRRRAEWDVDRESTSTDGTEPGSPSSTQMTTTATVFTRYLNYAVEQATATTQQAVAAISPAIAAGGIDAAPSSSKPPMQYALEGLSYLQSLHSRTVSDGWMLVSDKGFPVQRKIVPEISSVIHVHKGEKVIEGVSSEEVANVLSSYECRRLWDNRFDSFAVFESFGADAHTGFMTCKTGFPWRDRGFYLATLLARTTLARRNGIDAADQGSDNRTAVFLVSASFSPESVQSFSQAKYNPYSLPIGRTFIDGWILETLDPYGAESYAIPSTRCTRVVAVDYAGSIPAAVNTTINSSLPRTIIALESYLKGVSSPPITRVPAWGLMLSSKNDGDYMEKSWTLRKRSSSHLLMLNSYTPGDRTFKSMMTVNLSPPIKISSPSGLGPSERHSRSKTLASSTATIRPSDTQGSPNSSDDLSFISTSPGKAATLAGPRSLSHSRDMLRSSSMFTVRGEVRHPTDLLVGELVVDTNLYPEGYHVKLRSRVEKGKIHLALPSSLEHTLEESVLPISSSIYTLPPSPLHSSGLNADRPPCHLLRFVLPTAQYQTSTIQDPLTGEMRTAPPKPQWLLELEEGRAVVCVEIKPMASDLEEKLSKISVDGTQVAVLNEKESLTSLGRDELLDTRSSKMDLLIQGSSDGEPVPPELQSPVAVAKHLMNEVFISASDKNSAVETPGAEDPESSQPEGLPMEEKAPQDAPVPTEAPPDSAAGGLLRFLNSYPNPLTRLTGPVTRGGPILRTLSGSNIASRQVSGSAPSDACKGPSGLSTNQTQTEQSSTEGYDQAACTRGSSASRSRSYPLSTLIVAVLIAFLIGSLLRSMLSPADFVYVVTDARDAEDVSSGWREIKRLFELKYIVGGWDFQIALVRRQ